MIDTQLAKKYEQLKKLLCSYGRAAVAFSAGVDSTLLLAAAADVLGDGVLAVSVSADWVPEREIREAAAFCRSRGIAQVVLRASADEIDGFGDNPPDRCYLCKRALFTKIIKAAAAQGMDCIAEGSNADDTDDFRPGLRALAELGIQSPLREAGLTKSEIRELSRELGLSTAEKPSFACLASRIPYGESVTSEKLSMADQGERFLQEKGFRQFRVRVHGTLARIELLPEEMGRMMEQPLRGEVYDAMKRIGFSYVALDIKGYRTGSLNEVLPQNHLSTN